jgi:hypothetical protein
LLKVPLFGHLPFDESLSTLPGLQFLSEIEVPLLRQLVGQNASETLILFAPLYVEAIQGVMNVEGEIVDLGCRHAILGHESGPASWIR